VLSAILTKFGIAADQFPFVCVIVDKLDKIGADAVVELLVGQGVAEEAGRQIVASLSLKSVDELKGLMGDTDDGGAVEELVTIFEMAEAYGFGMLPRVVEPSPYPEP
jgi:histidyl-tRNA synthetase